MKIQELHNVNLVQLDVHYAMEVAHNVQSVK